MPIEQVRVRARFARRYVVLGLALAVIIGSAILIERPWAACPTDWSNAARIDLGSSSDVTLDGSQFQVGGDAALDYMPRGASPFDRLRGDRHPLTITATIGASSRDALGAAEFTCFRATHGNDLWAAGRPTAYGTQTAADGYPPGAPLPTNNEAWRLAVLGDGPEWPAGDQIGLEFWAIVHGQRYVFVLPPFALMKGG